MNAKEFFGAALRIIGVIVAGQGLLHVINSGLGVLGYFTTQRTAYSFYLITGLMELVAGLYLLRGAPPVMRFAYPPDAETEPGDLATKEVTAEETRS